MHMAGGGDAQGGEGGCTCILCIPPGYATGAGFIIYASIIGTVQRNGSGFGKWSHSG